MCGIAGIIDPRLERSAIAQAMQKMTDVIEHRGPDDDGHVVGDGIGIGMRRLSIIDVSGGQQPISNETGDIHVICNGEIYNHAELRQRLRSRGHQFQTGSDAEVIVHLYEDHGIDAIEHLRGMFGLAIWDQKRNKVVIARDRLGKKPLFFSELNGQFLFGSEMKSLLVANPELLAPNYKTLGHFFQFAYITQPDTIYQDIQRLPAGHVGVYENHTFSHRPYWNLEFKADESLSEQDWIERVDQTLADSVQARLESEVPLGVFLSGGLDSSAIVAYAHQAGLKPLKTFTIGFDRDEWDESDDAARVAKHFGTDHHLLRINERDLQESLPSTLQSIVRHCDEPFGDASALPTWHVSKLAREHVTVILSGDGGDELFAGYSSYVGTLFAEKYRQRVPSFLGRHILPALPAAASHLLPGRWKYQAQRVAKILRDSSRPLDRAYRDKTCIWSDHELRELFHADIVAESDHLGQQYFPDDIWRIMHGDGDLVSRLTHMDIKSYMLDDILIKVDRMSMAHSLEVRSPLLDHHMVELAASMPTRFKIQKGQGKAIFRKVLAKHLPPRTMNKRKQGFSVPLRDWFRGPLSDMLNDYLVYDGGSLPQSIFNPAKVQSILGEHQKGKADHANKIWLLLVFAAWHDHYQTGSFAKDAASLSTEVCS